MNQSLIEQLRRKGYAVHHQGGTPSRWWFTWCHPDGNTDVETGPTVGSFLDAWRSALEHWFANAEIPRCVLVAA